MSKIVIAGGTGYVGRALVASFRGQGDDVIVLSRGGGIVEGATSVRWDADPTAAWTHQLEDADAVINLCGAPVSKKWTMSYKDEVYDSRIDPTKTLGMAIGKCTRPPKLWINISGVGYYGDRSDHQLSEASTSGKDFLAATTVDWEAACLESQTIGTHKLIVRLGVVLSKKGGAFAEFKKIPFGGIGSGRQWISWVHLADVCAMMAWAVQDPFDGVLNCCAPEPVTNATFFKSLLAARGLPPVPPMPEFMFRAAAAATGMEASVVLEGQRVMPVVAQSRGFAFQYPTLKSALDDLL